MKLNSPIIGGSHNENPYDYELPGDPVANASLNTGRLAAKEHRAGGLAFNEYDYAYTARGNLSDIDEAAGVSRSRNYTYDDLERLTVVESPDAVKAAKKIATHKLGAQPKHIPCRTSG